MLISAIIFISLALVFYTAGVWGEKLTGRLKWVFLILFWLGFIMDSTGTALMSEMAGANQFNIHSLTGAAAIILMLFHAIWATYVLLKKQERLIVSFHKFSLVVWFVWLIPYLSGLFMNM
ncbi:HsmA family protein [Spirochaeta isovalerica]|uniref:Putative repeat protein (TIGR03987 family) n=1 Tax=Spirochaeta isovalerica TaxID=150 RepID=A0A841R8T7_9SPIO|nr:HsmA family protein [Spirochaeta isovalerica]MBB6478892.1 putative repeat protein (TIGR03987 family) [Spirochaeta isovalerica]